MPVKQSASSINGSKAAHRTNNDDVLKKITELYLDLFDHDGYGDLRVEIKILKREQKEVIVHCGKQYRFVVDYPNKR